MLILANVGVPMLLCVGPVLLLGLIPIMAIEADIYNKRLSIPYNDAASGALKANLLSTLVGVPFTWLALVILQFITGGGGDRGLGLQAVTWQAPWLMPYESSLKWMIPAAALFLNIPFFLMSFAVERWFLAGKWPNIDPSALRRACWRANAITYAALTAFWALFFIPTLYTAITT